NAPSRWLSQMKSLLEDEARSERPNPATSAAMAGCSRGTSARPMRDATSTFWRWASANLRASQSFIEKRRNEGEGYEQSASGAEDLCLCFSGRRWRDR